MLKILKKINLPIYPTSGPDCLKLCLNKTHFKNYSKKITYQYNSNGFRDKEWPTNLSDVIWCLGDSFTVGLGQPIKETWPSLLEKKSKKRCLNLGEDGCSNDTICLRAQEICKLYNPKLIIIMWSYFHRRRRKNQDIHFDKNNFGNDKDAKNFLKNFNIVKKLPTQTLNLLIPNAFTNNKKHMNYFLTKNNLKDILVFDQLDYSRDYHHFDIKTSEFVCNLIIEKIKDLDN
jgi:hypothetical protein